MPAHGQWKPLDSDLPAARRDLALCVRSLLDASGLSLRKVERQAQVSRSVLSALSNGRQTRPSAGTLTSLLNYTVRRCPDATLPTKEELERLCHRVWMEADEQTRVEAALAELVASESGTEPASAVADSGAPVGETGGGASPVELLQGDRQVAAASADLLWRPVGALRAHLESPLHQRDATLMMDHVGIEAPAEEAAIAIASCRQAGMDEAADTILRHVGNRESSEVLVVMRALTAYRQADDVRLLLSYSSKTA